MILFMSTPKYSDCPQLLRDFLFYMLTIQGRSPRTVDGYYVDLKCFFRYHKARKLSGQIPDDLSQVAIHDVSQEMICTVTLSDVYEFLTYAQTDRSNGANTRSRKVSALRSFYKYLSTKTQLLEESPLKSLDVPAVRKTLPKYLTLEESLQLLSVVDGPARERDYCILTFLLNCGMRLSELVGINLADIRDDRTLRLLGKGNKERIIYLNDACLAAVADYLKVRKQPAQADQRGALFLSRSSKRLTPRRVEQIVEENLKLAGLSGRGYSPHKLRHTAATLMYQHGGVDIRILQDILGHRNLGTTEIYTHISSTQMEKAAQSSPLSRVTSKKKKQ